MHRTQAGRESAEHVERPPWRRPRLFLSPAALAPPLPAQVTPQSARDEEMRAQRGSATCPRTHSFSPQQVPGQEGWPVLAGRAGVSTSRVSAGLFPMGAQGPLKVLTSRGGSMDELPGAAQDHGNLISLSSGARKS